MKRWAVDSTPQPGGSPIDLAAFVGANIGPIAVGLLVAIAALSLATLGLLRRVDRLSRRLEVLTRGSDDVGSLEDILGSHLERVRQVVRDVDHVAARTAVLERDLKGVLNRVGIVRYNAFEDAGGSQSFVLAVVDGRGDGFVVSSLHARSGTRTYAKAVTGGAAESALSDEEAEALRHALAKPAPGSAA